MTRQQVGWYDGSRVHQLEVRKPGAPVPRHLAHTAGWVAVYVEAAPVAAPLPPSLQAEAQAVGAGGDPESIEAGDPA